MGFKIALITLELFILKVSSFVHLHKLHAFECFCLFSVFGACFLMVLVCFCVWCLVGCLLQANGSPRVPFGSLFGFLLLPLGCERSARSDDRRRRVAGANETIIGSARGVPARMSE